jgi:hypothetical protein
VAAVVALALAGCGSTVQVRSTATVGQGGLNELGTTGGAVSTTTGGGSAVQNPGTTGAVVPQGTSGTTGASTGGVPTPTSVASAGTTTGAVATNEPIKIGVITQPGLETAAKAFGLDGVTTGDTKAQVEAVVAWIRANGGLGGHPIQVFEYAIDMSQTSAEVWQTNACASMAEDHKVRFVVTVLASLQTLAACLAKHGIGLLADNSNFGDKTMAQYAPIMGNPSELGVGRMMTLLVDDLWRQGWLKAGSKIGVLALDSPDGRATTDGPFMAALRKHGLKPASTVYINPNNGDGGSSASGNAVLTFRASNVDRIIPVMYSPLYFMLAAESQRYYPAYAMVSANGPGALLEGTAPQNQLKNAAGIGWAPYLDIGKGPKPPPVNARATLCFELMKKGGQAATSALVKGFQAQVCDVLFYLKDLTDLAPTIPGDLLTSARIRLGTGFVSPATYRVDVTHRTAGVGGYRSLAYLDSCTCFQYVSPVVAAS